MKILKYMAVAAAAVFAASCTLELDQTRLADADAMSAPVLNKVANITSDANTGNESVVFTWSPADIGASAQIQYSLYAKMGEKEALIANSFTNYAKIVKGDLVGVVVNDLGGAKNTDVPVEAYVKANLYGTEGNVVDLTSNSVKFSVFTYLPAKKKIWLPGKYQGWSQYGTEVWEYAAGSSQYKILVDVSNPDETPYYFKIVDESGAWVGMNDGYKPDGWEVADASNSDGNFSVLAEEGILYLTIDTKKKTVAREVYSKVALVGAFNDWNTETEPLFTYDATQNLWISPAIDFTVGGGQFLVRLNGDWGLKYGSASPSSDIAGGYEITLGGENIAGPTDGTYIVKLHGNVTPFVIEYEKQ